MDKWKWLMQHGLLFAEDGGGEGGGGGGEGGQPQEGAAQQPTDDLPQDRETLVKIIAGLRKENGDERIAAKQKAADEAKASMAQEIGKILGLVDEKPTLESLAEQIKSLQAPKPDEKPEEKADNTMAVELAIFKSAKEHGANPAMLTDSVSFLAKVKDLDPTAADFQTKVVEAAKEAVTANPTLRAGNGSASGVDHTGGSGGQPKKSISIESAVGKALGG